MKVKKIADFFPFFGMLVASAVIMCIYLFAMNGRELVRILQVIVSPLVTLVIPVLNRLCGIRIPLAFNIAVAVFALFAINFLIEYVLGLQREKDTLIWRVHQCDRHGVKKFPFGKTGTFDLICEKRKKGEKPVVTVKGNEPLKLKIIYENGEFTVNYKVQKNK